MRRQMSPRASGLGAGVEPLGRHARLLQGRHLVGHQRDQRRDDEAEARPDQRRDLVAQALAAAGRQHGQRAAPGQHLADHAGLQAAEVGVAERAAQDVARGVERRGLAASSAYADLGIGLHECLMQRAPPGRKPARRVFNRSTRHPGRASPGTGERAEPGSKRARWMQLRIASTGGLGCRDDGWSTARKGYLILRGSTADELVDSDRRNGCANVSWITARLVLALALIAGGSGGTRPVGWLGQVRRRLHLLRAALRQHRAAGSLCLRSPDRPDVDRQRLGLPARRTVSPTGRRSMWSRRHRRRPAYRDDGRLRCRAAARWIAPASADEVGRCVVGIGAAARPAGLWRRCPCSPAWDRHPAAS